MKTPPFFIGAAILFWGYERNLLLLSLAPALLLEGGRFIKTRWQLEKEDYVKISDLTSIILLAAITLIVMNYKPEYFLITVTGWIPLIFLPLALAQVYGTEDKIIIGSWIGSKRNLKRRGSSHPEGEINPSFFKGKRSRHLQRSMDFSFIYGAATLFSAASVNSRHEAFFPIFFFLTGWILFSRRGRAFSLFYFFTILVFGLLLSFSSIKGVEKGRSYLEQRMTALWEGHMQSMGADPFKAHTSFGDIEQLKLSGKIIIRLQSSEQPPVLLKEAGYAVFSKTFWFNRDRAFTVIPAGRDESWKLVDELSNQSRSLHIEKYFTQDKGLLPFPYGIEEVRGLNISELTRNGEGILRFEEGETLQIYDIAYVPPRAPSTLPNESNLLIPEDEEAALRQIISDLGLAALPEKEKAKRIQRFFQERFSYTLTTRGKGAYTTPLANFLLHTRAGHCELFATATALLLRTAGIPSRYITGYAVSEESFSGQEYIIRNRHAHAWAEGFIKGEWIVLDTTPSIWLEEDKQNTSSLFEPVRDFFSFIKHQINLFRARKNQEYNLPLSIAVVLLTTFLIFRIYQRLNKEKVVTAEEKEKRIFRKQDSPFDSIEKALNGQGPRRRKNEVFSEWLERISAAHQVDSAQLLSLHNLHQRLRFDPSGIGEKDMARLQEGVASWLKQDSGDSKQEAAMD